MKRLVCLLLTFIILWAFMQLTALAEEERITSPLCRELYCGRRRQTVEILKYSATNTTSILRSYLH
jgi:hypothetical protein